METSTESEVCRAQSGLALAARPVGSASGPMGSRLLVRGCGTLPTARLRLWRGIGTREDECPHRPGSAVSSSVCTRKTR